MIKPQTDITILDEAAVAELANRDVCDHNCAMLTPTERDALCATVRALQKQNEVARGYASHFEAKYDALQSQLEQVATKRRLNMDLLKEARRAEGLAIQKWRETEDERDRLRAQLEQITRERDRLKEDLRILTQGRFIQS